MSCCSSKSDASDDAIHKTRDIIVSMCLGIVLGIYLGIELLAWMRYLNDHLNLTIPMVYLVCAFVRVLRAFLPFQGSWSHFWLEKSLSAWYSLILLHFFVRFHTIHQTCDIIVSMCLASNLKSTLGLSFWLEWDIEMIVLIFQFQWYTWFVHLWESWGRFGPFNKAEVTFDLRSPWVLETALFCSVSLCDSCFCLPWSISQHPLKMIWRNPDRLVIFVFSFRWPRFTVAYCAVVTGISLHYFLEDNMLPLHTIV